MPIYALQALAPVILTAGRTNSRNISVLTETAEATIGGTYTLLGPNGSAVSGCSNLSITAGVVSVPVPALSSSVALGSGYTEQIVITSGTGSGITRYWTSEAHVWTWSMNHEEVLASPVHFTTRYPNETRYPSGVTSWEQQAVIASGLTMTDAVRRLPATGSQLVSRSSLFRAGFEMLCVEVFRVLYSRGNPGARESMLIHREAYEEEWRTILAGIDTTGDGVRDTQARPVDAPGGPPPGPLA
jgi:hypothetical protein